MELIAAVADKTDLTRAKAGEAVDAVFGAIEAALKARDEVRLTGFGSFSTATRKVDVVLPPGELAARRAAWVAPKLVNQTPWEEIYRSMVGQLGTGACLEQATLFLDVIETRGEARNNH